MALIPIYRWVGLDDDLTGSQKWLINFYGLLAAVAAAHFGGYVDLTAIGPDVLSGLPGTQQAVVVLIAAVSVAVFWITISERSTSDVLWIVAATTAGFFLVDLFFIHPAVFDNIPSLLYWAAKPIWVGVPMFVVAFWLLRNTEMFIPFAYTIAGVAGIVSLQLYYTAIPIPVVNGDPIQVGLVGNLTTGVEVHGGGLLLALAVIVIAIEGRRRFVD